MELYKISSKGTVPVLHLNNNDVIDESLEIMLWVNKLNENILLNTNSEKQLKLINKNDADFKFWLDRYKYFDRFPDKSQDYYFNQSSKFIIQIEQLLKNNTYIINDKIQLVDLAIFPFIRQFLNVNKNLFKSKFPVTNIWYLKISESDRFKNIMQKYNFWSNNDKPLFINLHHI